MALTNPKSVINVEELSYFKSKLAKTDSAVAGQLVSAVSETGGIISVSRRGLAETDVKLVAVASPDTQYAAQYQLVAGSTQLGATINIPKDQFLKDAQLYKSKADVPQDKRDYPEGTEDSFFPAIRFEFQLPGTTSALWVSVKDLVDTYTGGTGIDVTGTTISFKNGNGLAPDSDGKIEVIHDASLAYISQGQIGVNKGEGLELAEATTGAGQKLTIKLDGTTLSKGTNGVKVSSTYDVTLEKVANKTTTIAASTSASDTKYPTEKAVRTELDKKQDNLSAGNGIDATSLASKIIAAKVVAANGLSVGTNGIAMAVASTSDAGAMSAADKAKLDGIEAQANKGVKTINAGNGIDIQEGTDATEVTVKVYLAQDSGLEFTGTNDEALTCKFAEDSDIDEMFS